MLERGRGEFRKRRFQAMGTKTEPGQGNPHNQEFSNVMSYTNQPPLLLFSLWRVTVMRNFSSTSRKQNRKFGRQEINFSAIICSDLLETSS